MSNTVNTEFDAIRVLGCSEDVAASLLRGRRVTPGEVETLALTHYEWWRHLRDRQSYWVTVSQAARILHLAPGRVRRMLDEDRLPHVVHVSGVRLMRRHEIEQRSRDLAG
ncbi:MAG: helix-turn-helix domain-containing protein [Nocardioidaceae bacterium]